MSCSHGCDIFFLGALVKTGLIWRRPPSSYMTRSPEPSGDIGVDTISFPQIRDAVAAIKVQNCNRAASIVATRKRKSPKDCSSRVPTQSPDADDVSTSYSCAESDAVALLRELDNLEADNVGLPLWSGSGDCLY